jgi:formylglycine-generating enzyme required for sulfatase activity
VTVEQFLQFWKGKGKEYLYSKDKAPTQDCPAIEVSWYEAAEYCNWLSQREGIAEAQWCYEIIQGAVPALAASTVGLLGSALGPTPFQTAALVFPRRTDHHYLYGNQMKIKAGYLGLNGYRLPTEAEWEYACRAGSTVNYSFGEPAELLERYGWFLGNSLTQTHPCGMLKPNDLGLFDMHGNVSQWTHTIYSDKPIEKEDDGGELIIRASGRVYRGGDWGGDTWVCRAEYRFARTPVYRDVFLGFRPARVPVHAGGR